MNCYYCGDDAFTLIADSKEIRFECFGKDKRVLRCLNCGLAQLLPQWTKEELDELYAKYWEKEDFEGQKRKVKVSKYLIKYIDPWDLCLEVGNGHGDNIRFLRSKGYWVIGIDKDQQMQDEIDADIFEYEFSRKFNFIYAIHFFEHMADPRKFINWLKENLMVDGKYLLEIPSLDDPLLKLEKFRKFYWYPYHLFFYDSKTIRHFFPDAKIVRRQEYGLVNHLRWLFKGKPGNWNPHIPILDDIYKFVLTHIGYGDTLVVVGSV